MHSGHSACSSSPLLLFITFMMTPEDDTSYVQNPLPRSCFTEPRQPPFEGVAFDAHTADANALDDNFGYSLGLDFTWSRLNNRTRTYTFQHTFRFSAQLNFLLCLHLSFFFCWLISDSSLFFFLLLQARSPPVPVGLSLACSELPRNLPDRGTVLRCQQLMCQLPQVILRNRGTKVFSQDTLHTQPNFGMPLCRDYRASESRVRGGVAQLRDVSVSSARLFEQTFSIVTRAHGGKNRGDFFFFSRSQKKEPHEKSSRNVIFNLY